jgi:DNA-binding transcriptional regulator YiaG
MNPPELRQARTALGLSAEGFARLVQVQSGRTVRKWEAGERDIPGPVAVLLGAIMSSSAVRRHFGLSTADDSATLPG